MKGSAAVAAAGRPADKKSAVPPAGGKAKSASPTGPPRDAHVASGPPVVTGASAVEPAAPAAVSVSDAAVSRVSGKRAERRTISLSARHGGVRGLGSRPRPATRKPEPRLRPKKTHSGLEEKMEATDHAYGVFVHWDSYAGHHVHVLPPTVDAMHEEEMLLVPSCSEVETKEKADLARDPLLSCGLTPCVGADVTQHPSRHQRQGRHQRHCIPLYRFQPQLCEKSRRIVDEHRETRLSNMWEKIDIHGEGVVDFFSAPWVQAAAAAGNSSHTNIHAENIQGTDSHHMSFSAAPSGMHRTSSSCAALRLANEPLGVRSAPPSATSSTLRSGVDQLHVKHLRDHKGMPAGSAFLSPVEERFIEAALLPRFVTTAMLPENQKIARAIISETTTVGSPAAAATTAAGESARAGASSRPGSVIAAQDTLKEAKVAAITKNLVLLLDCRGTGDSERLTPEARVRGATTEGGVRLPAAAAEQTKAEAAKRAEERTEEGERDVDRAPTTEESVSGSGFPYLLVPKAAFIKTGLLALQHCFGEATTEAAAAVDAFRDLLVRECSRHVRVPPRQQSKQQQYRQRVQSSWQLGHLSVHERPSRAWTSHPPQESRASAQYISETACSPYLKPYILHYARQLEHKRRKAEQQQELVSAAHLATPSCNRVKDHIDKFSPRFIHSKGASRRYPPRCLQPLPLSAAADWASAVAPTGSRALIASAATTHADAGVSVEAEYKGTNDEKTFPGFGLRRVMNRFDEQIAHYLRKKLQLGHLKKAMEDMQQREFCSFHPAVNKTPRYLKQLRKQKERRGILAGEQQDLCTNGWLVEQLQGSGDEVLLPPSIKAAADPMEVLALYCKYYTEDPQYERLVQEIRECSFQPNISKFVKKEKKRQQQLQKQEVGRQKPQEEHVQRQNSGKDEEKQQRRSQFSESVSRGRNKHSDTKNGVYGHSKDAGVREEREENRREGGKAEQAQASAAADELFAMLDAPFDAIFQTDIRQWLYSRDGKHYSRCLHDKRETRRSSSGVDSPASTDTQETASETESTDEDAAPPPQRHEWKKWIREKRQPQYRGPRERSIRPSEMLSAWLDDDTAVAAGNPLAADAAVAVKDRVAAVTAAAEKAAKLPSSNAYNRWVEGLRGGYLSNSMDFSAAGEEGRGEDERKKRRYCMRDWGHYIRLEQRAVEARVLPNRDIADSLCEAYMPSAGATFRTEVPEPTVWNPRRRRWKPAEERKPSAYTYTQANFCSGNAEELFRSREEGLPSDAVGTQREFRSIPDAAALSAPLPAASRAARYAQNWQQELQQERQQQPEVRGLLRMTRSGEKQKILQDLTPTTFILPTPVKAHKVREQFRMYVQLRHGIDTGEIYVPPRVCAVRRPDALQLLEKEIEENVPQLLLLTSDRDASGTLLRDEAEQERVATEAAPAPTQPNELHQHTDEETEKDSPHEDGKEENEVSWSRASTAAADWAAEEEEKKLDEARKTATRRKATTDPNIHKDQ